MQMIMINSELDNSWFFIRTDEILAIQITKFSSENVEKSEIGRILFRLKNEENSILCIRFGTSNADKHTLEHFPSKIIKIFEI